MDWNGYSNRIMNFFTWHRAYELGWRKPRFSAPSLITKGIPGTKQNERGWLCPLCGLERQSYNGPDPCLGYLPGVEFACCGHGRDHGYIKFSNGIIIYFKTITRVLYKIDIGIYYTIVE